MKKLSKNAKTEEEPDPSIQDLLAQRTLIPASNRGPVTLHRTEIGDLEYQRGSGGLVTALTGVIQHSEAHWVACAQGLAVKVLQPSQAVNATTADFCFESTSETLGWLKSLV